MELFIPEQVQIIKSWNGWSDGMGSRPYGTDYYGQGECYIFLPCNAEASIPAPSLFVQTKGRRENDVCHMKYDRLGNANIIPMVAPNGRKYPPWGFLRDPIRYYGDSSDLAFSHNYRYSNFIAMGIPARDYCRIELYTVFNSPSGPITTSLFLYYYTVEHQGVKSFYLGKGYDKPAFLALPKAIRSYLMDPDGDTIVARLRQGIRIGTGYSKNTKPVIEHLLSMDYGYHWWVKNLIGLGDARLTWGSKSKPIIPELRPPDDLFIFNEYQRFDGTSLYLLGGGIANHEYWRKKLMQDAFLDSVNKLPKLSDNMISNIHDICSFIYELVVNRKIAIPKSLQDAWLKYRYSYSTTKADIKDAISFMSRATSFDQLEFSAESYGSSTEVVEGCEVTCRCAVKIHSNDLNRIKSVWRALERYGLTPDFYMIWDMIPYSFIIDWFIPIGDVASTLDAEYVFIDSGWYGYDKIVYSLSYKIPHNDTVYSAYTRWCENSPPDLSFYYCFGRTNPSDKVITTRLIDSAALLIK